MIVLAEDEGGGEIVLIDPAGVSCGAKHLKQGVQFPIGRFLGMDTTKCDNNCRLILCH